MKLSYIYEYSLNIYLTKTLLIQTSPAIEWTWVPRLPTWLSPVKNTGIPWCKHLAMLEAAAVALQNVHFGLGMLQSYAPWELQDMRLEVLKQLSCQRVLVSLSKVEIIIFNNHYIYWLKKISSNVRFKEYSTIILLWGSNPDNRSTD